VQVAANGSHHHLTAIQPDPNVDRDAFGALHLGGILLHLALHGERRIAGPHRMVLMANRRPEECHDAVAHDLVDRAFVAVHGGHHAFEHGVEQLMGFFRVAVGQQLHRAFQVREEYGHLLALAFEGGLGGEDFLSQISRGIAQR
jgi:hypothetical protein